MKTHRDEFLKAYSEKVKTLEASIKEKDEMILAMRECLNCSNYQSCFSYDPHTIREECIDYSNWQMKGLNDE